MTPNGADIYCRVIDNYGDIGVCWRLARQLRHQLPRVRLWVDDLHSFTHINPEIQPHLHLQRSQGVEVLNWRQDSVFPPPLELLIEAFACELPESVKQHVGAHTLWLNLEYLSAEKWVPSFHLGASPQAGGQTKYFFFPGFTPETGGLLREKDLVSERDALQANSETRRDFLRYLGVDEELVAQLAQRKVIFLFCYPNAPVQELLQVLQEHNTLLLVPASVAQHFTFTPTPKLALHILPPISQTDFDRVLWCSDLNIVRGEDSLVRAIWSAKPMIWQPYYQDDNWHLEKLAAWLQHTSYSPSVQQAHYAWSQANGHALFPALEQLLQPHNWSEWQAEAASFSEKLVKGPELSNAILSFYAQVARTR